MGLWFRAAGSRRPSWSRASRASTWRRRGAIASGACLVEVRVRIGVRVRVGVRVGVGDLHVERLLRVRGRVGGRLRLRVWVRVGGRVGVWVSGQGQGQG